MLRGHSWHSGVESAKIRVAEYSALDAPVTSAQAKSIMRAHIEALIAALSHPDAPHDASLHVGADPLDNELSYCPVCSGVVALRRLQETL